MFFIPNKVASFICIASCFLFACSQTSTKNGNEETFQEKHASVDTSNAKLTAYRVLDLEKQAGIDFSPECYKILDELVNKISAKILVKEHYTKKEAEVVLESIGNSMAEYGIKVVDTSYSINSSLVSKKLCCYGCSFTYLTVAEKLNLPISAAIAPGHIFVIWNDGENEIWWETTGNFISDKKYYIDYFKLSKGDIGTLNLRSLSNKELEGIMYSQAAIKAEEHTKIEYLTKSLELCPNYESGYKNRGNAKYKLKDFKGAEADWKKVLEINPTYNDFEFFVDFGCVKNELDDYKGAVEAFNVALKIDSKKDGAYLNRGIAKQLLGDTIGAIADYTNAIALNLNGFDAYNNRGIAYYFTGKYMLAIVDFNIAVKNGLNNATTFYYRGVAKTQLHKFQDAILDFDRTLLIDPNYVKAYFNRGVSKLLLKDLSGGCSDLVKADQMGDVDAMPIMIQYCK